MRIAFTTSLLLVALTLTAPIAGSHTGEAPAWPSWRGPTGNGLAAANAAPPLSWSERENIRWKVALPGLGCSSPVVDGERIYLTTAIDLEAAKDASDAGPQPGPPNADHTHQFVVLSIDRDTGEEAWRTVVGEAKPHEKGHSTGSHASASVNLSGDRVIAFFGSRGLHGLDLDGKLLWSKQFGEMKTLVGFGEASTPAVHGDTIVVQWDEEGPSFVAAFSARDGKELWRQARDLDTSWGSPVIVEVDGNAQVILTGSDETRAYALEDGKQIWRCGGMSKNPVNSALVADGMLYVMNSYKGKVIQAIRLAGAKGDVTESKGMLWTRKRDAAYVPPPLVLGGNLFYLRDSTGILNCLDAATGEAHFAAKRLESIKRIHASPIAAAGRVYFSSREGITVVIRADNEFEILATNELDDVFDATPAFVGSEIYMRGRSHLYCIAQAGE